MDEVKRLGSLEGSEINQAKETLAYEVTKLVHGEEEAEARQRQNSCLVEARASTCLQPPWMGCLAEGWTFLLS